MALLRKAQLSSSQRLKQAIASFENELSPEQKAQFQIEALPGVDNVMQLTAEIDSAASTQITEFRRCYGTRVTSFLEGVQEVAKVIDIGIGAAKSTTASGIWCAVRFLLLASTQAPNPYIDKLSDLFLSLGPSTHRFRNMAILFPRSQRLRDAVFEYYIIVVDMCCEILKLSKKSNLARYWTVFAKDSYTAKLDKCARQIMEELNLENSRKAQEEIREQSIFRAQSRQHQELQKFRQFHVLRKQLLDACSIHDYKTTWKQVRDLGSTVLLQQNIVYQEWKNSTKSCTMVYTGKLGSGKSVLLANMVGDLHLQNKAGSQVVYFFCRRDLRDSLLPRTIFGCIAKQLLSHCSDLEEHYASFDIDVGLDMDDVIKLIKKTITRPVYLVLDGLDVCEVKHQEEILRHLQDLQKVCFCRIGIGTADPALWTTGEVQVLTARMPDANPDIPLYVEREVNQCLQTRKLIISDPELVDKVKKVLVSDADGMFLWVHLQIFSLCLMKSDYDIEEALKQLPKSLSEVYAKLLKFQSSSYHRSALFRLVLAAHEPLTASQLREALSVEPGNTMYILSKVLNSIEHVVTSCAGLLVIDEEEETVRFTHHSVADFLTSGTHEFHITSKLAANDMTTIILTYLNYSLFETQMTIRETHSQVHRGKPRMEAATLPAAILADLVPGGRMIFKPSRTQGKVKLSERRSLPTLVSEKQFLAYVESHWFSHITECSLDDRQESLLRLALRLHRIDMKKEIFGTESPVITAIRRRCVQIVSIFLDYDQEMLDSERMDILRAAAVTNGEDIIEAVFRSCGKLPLGVLISIAIKADSSILWNLLRAEFRSQLTGKLNNEWLAMDHHTILTYAIKCDAISIVAELFCEPNADFSQKVLGYSPLMHAIKEAQDGIIKLISGKGELVAVESQNELWTATFETYGDASDLEGRRDPNAIFGMIRNTVARLEGRRNPDAILRILLHNKCLSLNGRWDKSGKVYRTPLQEACVLGLSRAVKVILDFNDEGVNLREKRPNPRYRYQLAEGGGNPRYRFGGTAWDLAKTDEIKTLLEQHGAKRSYVSGSSNA